MTLSVAGGTSWQDHYNCALKEHQISKYCLQIQYKQELHEKELSPSVFPVSNDFLAFWHGRQVWWYVLLLRLDWVTYMWDTCPHVSDFGHTVYEGERGFPDLQFELSLTKASLQKKHLLLLGLTGRRRWSCSRGQHYLHPNPHQALSSNCKSPSDVRLQR